jgi:MGT family glycosyltransferase
VGKNSRLKGEECQQFVLDAIAAIAEAKWRILPKLLVSLGIDAVVLDDCDFHGATIPIHLGMPYAILSNAIHFDYSGYTPFCYYDYAHESTPEGIRRNRQGVAKFIQMLVRSHANVIAQVKKTGINGDWENPSSWYSGYPWITQCPREFDFESSHWPRHFHYAGPFHDRKGRIEVPFPWDKLTGEPIVYASMGTLQNGNADVFRTIVTAVSKHNRFQLVLSIGNAVRPEQIGPLPTNAIVVNNAPQLELLKKASMCITHEGLNTVLEALAQGVPQIAIPVTNDQPGVAARIAHRQTGVVTSLDKLTPGHLSELLTEVLINSTYRANAQKLQRKIVEANRLSVAADVVEEALGGRKKPNAL